MQNSVREGAPFEPVAGATAPYSSNMPTTSMDDNSQPTAPAFSYDEVFPALPESNTPPVVSSNHLGQWSNKMRISSSTVTQVFIIPSAERKQDQNENFGESESMRICTNIMQQTGAHIEISSSKDQDLTFLVTGRPNAVLDARKRILQQFQTQSVYHLNIPKDHHRHLLGKQGKNLKELEAKTSCKITIPPIADLSDVITVTGPKDGIEKAVHEIQSTSDELSKQASEVVTVPKIYHPFIIGAHSERINALTAETGVRINVPPPSVQKDDIRITGEKEGVQAAKESILAVYQEISKKCNQISVEVPKAQHKYVIGPRGSTLADILKDTGVSVEMPPSEANVDTITLRGPQDKLCLALNMVYQKANSVTSNTVKAPSWLHKYIIGKKGANIRNITQDYSKVHVEFIDDKIRIEGPPEEVEKVEEQLQAVTKNLQSTLIFAELKVDPKFYKHIIGKNGANVNRLKDETNVVINIEDDGGTANIIRIEGNPEGVNRVKKELEDMVFKLENEKEKDIIIDHKFYPSIIGAKGDKIREIKETFNQVTIIFPNPSEKRDVVKIRGPKEDVDRCSKHLMKLVKELTEENYRINVPIYKQFHKFVIGKGGANIRKIRDETQTKIDLPSEGETSDVIIITGREKNVHLAKERIQKIQDELANIVTEDISIPPKFYNSLIGARGKLIQAISEECGGVQIKFPDQDSHSDKVIIRGPKDDVERAIQQLGKLKNEREAASHTGEVKAKPEQHKFLIGKGGSNINKIRESTGARIMFPSEKDEDKETIIIMGTKEQVELAKQELERTIKDIVNTTEDAINVSPKHHKYFVARRGQRLNEISDECGNVSISFPRPNVDSEKVVLKGSKDSIEAAKQRIQEIVRDLESRVTIDCVIKQNHHRTVMGTRGHKVQRIQADYNVEIKFPDRENPGTPLPGDYDNEINGGDDAYRASDTIRITGLPDNCEKAKLALLELVPIEIEVEVPYDLHRSIIGKSGQEVRKLMNEHDVHITLSPAEQKLDYIKIYGAPVNVDSAKAALLDRVEVLEKDRKDRELKSFQITLEVDPEYHPKIIGRKGTNISRIREEYGVQINFPKKGSPDEHIITITGYEDKSRAALEHIRSLVNELKDQYREEISVDSRVHSRLIGQRGRAIHKIMEDYRVEVKFPRQGDTDPDLVVITGEQENVEDAKAHILNLAEEYMMDSEYDVKRPASYQLILGADERGQGDANAEGFVVRGGPWEQSSSHQRRPDTASIEDFPSFGAPGAGEGPPIATWGPRR